MQNNGGYNKHRHSRSGGGHGHSHSHNHNRPRKNYSAMREKYLNQARDALAAGDRVMAEYFYQHADHCYRMMVEEGYNPRQNYTQGEQRSEQQATSDGAESATPAPEEEIIPANPNALPAFITAGYQSGDKPADPAMVQNWEERDAS